MLRILVIIIALQMVVCCCDKSKTNTKPPPVGNIVFEEHFETNKLEDHWSDTSAGKAYSVVDGKLRAKGAHNKPLWLKKKLPRNMQLDFTAKSVSPSVDIKVEVFGDGHSYAKRASYVASSYVVILGGWNNSLSVIARMNEHGKDRKVKTNPRARTNRKYAFSIVRKGNTLTWWLDGEKLLEMDDAKPLEGPDHEYFAINNWESEVYFDDIVIREL